MKSFSLVYYHFTILWIVLKFKVSLLLNFKKYLLNAKLLSTLKYVDFTYIYMRFLVFKKLAVSSIKIYVLDDIAAGSISCHLKYLFYVF